MRLILCQLLCLLLFSPTLKAVCLFIHTPQSLPPPEGRELAFTLHTTQSQTDDHRGARREVNTLTLRYLELLRNGEKAALVA